MFSLFFIDRPKFALVIAIVITLAGGIAIQNIPVAEFPQIAPPQVVVQAVYPGANAETVEQSVAAPIEAEVNGVDDMLYMSSTSSNSGSYQLTISFAVGTDPDIAAVNVQNRVALANSQLPSEVTRQGITTRKQSSGMLMVVSLTSPDASHDRLFLSNYASIYIQDRLARINGVGSVSQFGAQDYGMRVWIEPDRLAGFNLTAKDVADAISEQNIQATAGTLGAPPFEDTPQFQYSIQAKGRLANVEEFENIVIRANTDGSFVRLKDVARVQLGSQSYAAVSKLNGAPAANIAIYQSPGANALEVADQVYKELDLLQASFPPDMEYSILYDTTDSVRQSVQEVLETLFITFCLVVLVTFLFLADWRSTLIPTIAIPVSLIGTIAILLLVGYTVNMITLFALILAIGVVVDDSIVVVENVQRLIQSGLEVREATAKAMTQVTGPVIATTLVLLAVFIPVSFMPGVTGELYRQFSLTICVSVVISSINALTLAPALCASLLREQKTPKGILRWFAVGIEKSRNGYVSVVKILLRRTGLTLLGLAVIAVATGFMFKQTPTGFLPIEDKRALFVNVQLPDGASLTRTEEVTDGVAESIRAIPGVTDVIAISGVSILSGEASNAGLLIPILSHWDERQAFEERWFMIMRQINQQLAALPTAEGFSFPMPPIMGLGSGGGLEANILDLQGQSPQALAAAVRSLSFNANQDEKLQQVFSTYTANVPQLFLEVDREKAEILGISPADIFSTLQTNLGSSYINDFNLYGKSYRVVVQAEADKRDAVDDINHLHVRTASGEMVSLSTLVDIKSVLGPLAITRFNQFKSAAVQGTPAQGFSTGEAITTLETIAADTLPDGYQLQWTGTTQQELEAGNVVISIMLLAVLFAYLFLVAQYESWSLPVSVMLTVIVALFGALIPMYLLPFLNNNLYAQIGMVLLIGLASKTAILMVEFGKQRREEGATAYQAAVDAAELRFRAVMMTALSFILGVLPLVFASGAGAASRVSVGFVVVFGMLAATAIGIFFIPPLYLFFQSLRERLGSFRHQKVR
ncbi:MAG: efflux RND transporter permease subunit [Pseudomonadales bacterium]|nr:efflux RND transporter permease subunit [Pseudomonadales bacterium]